MRSWLDALHPRLRALDPAARRAVLRAANHEPLDAFELVAAGAAVIVLAWMHPGAALAAALGAAGVALLAWRRLRRGVRRALAP